MSILINKKTKVLVQGITGTQASFHVQRALKYGTKIVAGVVPSKKEDFHLGIPVFETVKEAKEKTDATASIVFVPAKFAKSAILEAIDAKLELVVVITSGIPVGDMMEIKHRLQNSKTILIGPNTPGVITPNEAYMGIFPDNIHNSGNIGIVSSSSTLTYEIVLEMNKIGLGQSTVVGLGDDFIVGSSVGSIIEKFNKDAKTKASVIITGIYGNDETEIIEKYSKLKNKKPVIALIIDDNTALSEANSIAELICKNSFDVSDRKNKLRDAGIIVVDNITDLKKELLKVC
ncbi:MAG: succinate--CoA ligase subunit alpha [Alphaproteobacteria bacterium]|nr:succinate--CoA ligase subunit alpha [Alphaproteobacteria bacterium]